MNPILNCVVDERFKEAIEEAIIIDDYLAKLSQTKRDKLFQQKPFLGIPFTIKDCFAAEGLSWSAGLYYRKSEKV